MIRQGFPQPVAAVEAGGAGQSGQDAFGPGMGQLLFCVAGGDSGFVGGDVGALGRQIVGFPVQDRR
ncbi:hypothetical protein [Nocardia sp. NPDC004604]|uniref:hypothetical protein n=1 Tax=Nocardia sp. NPDC004604 TaxID=3157013 RepID=UPI0033A69172